MHRTRWIAALTIAAMATAHAQQPGRYDVSQFGAVGDGKTIETEAINRAIDAAAAAGGGTVVFHRGTYLSGSIHLKSHVAILATGVHNLTVDNVKMDTNRDGIDVDACRNVRISNMTVNSPFDDGICLKSSYGLGVARATENVTITNSVFTYCRGLALETVDGGDTEDIAIDNIAMRDIVNAPIFIRRGNRARTPGEPPPGAMRRITISNIVASGIRDQQGILISGIPNYPIEDVRLSNIRIHYTGGGTAADAALDPDEKEKDYPEPAMLISRSSRPRLDRRSSCATSSVSTWTISARRNLEPPRANC